MNTKGLAQLTGMKRIPVSCANYLIISRISATAADVRTSPPHWIAGFLYVNRLGSCEKAH